MKKSKSLIMVSTIITVVIVINLLARLWLVDYKIDFTDDKRFSLSQNSIKLINNNNQEITFKFFFSDKLANGIPYLKTYAQRIKSFLDQFAYYSKGKIKVEFIDPEPYSDEEDQALSYGLKGVPIDKDETKAYLGLVAINSNNQQQVIPVFSFDREPFTEYEISRIIYALSNNKKPIVGVYSSLPIEQQNFMGLPGLIGNRAWIVMQQISQVMNIKIIKKDAKSLPEDIDLLMVVQPDKDISYEMLRAIDQYVISGKKALFFLDPYAESKNSLGENNSFDARFIPILRNWGIKLPNNKVIADHLAARKINDKTIKSQVDYLLWLAMQKQNLSNKDITTAGLKMVNLATSGYIEAIDQSEVKIEPLITSTKDSMIFDINDIKGKPDPAKIVSLFAPQNHEFILAARALGKARSYFSPTNQGNINIVVIADSDILKDDVWSTDQKFDGYQLVSPIADNGSFIVNILDNLSGSDDLISLRGRGTNNRPFKIVDKIRQQMQDKYLVQQKQLQEQLNRTEYKLSLLQKQSKEAKDDKDKQIYKIQQSQEIRDFTNKMVNIRKQQREIQKNMYNDIVKLAALIKFLNILLLPILISIIGVWYYRKA